MGNSKRETRRIVLYRAGMPQHYDVSIDWQAMTAYLGPRAERNRSRKAKTAYGSIIVEHIQ